MALRLRQGRRGRAYRQCDALGKPTRASAQGSRHYQTPRQEAAHEDRVTEIREEIEASTARFISELGDVSEAQRNACKRAAERVALADALRRRALSGAEIDIADLVKLE